MTGKLKKVLLPNLPYLLFVWLFDKLCQAVRLAPGLDVSEKLLHIGQGFQRFGTELFFQVALVFSSYRPGTNGRILFAGKIFDLFFQVCYSI